LANIIDYIDWRGDLDFCASPFNEIDAVILCQITYLDFEGLIPAEFCKKGVTLKQIAQSLSAAPDVEDRRDTGALINRETFDLFIKAANSNRFGKIEASGFVNKIDLQKEEQFAAATFRIKKAISNGRLVKNMASKKICNGTPDVFIVYRGTDDTIVGWKEDFNLGYKETVPAQQDALCYLENAASFFKGKISIAGHSKGGNLAIYAAVNAGRKIQNRLLTVYNNDGPGFSEDFFKTDEYLGIRQKIRSFFPQLSIVGMLFCHDTGYTTVESDNKGLYQHDPFSWHTKAVNFVQEEDTTEQSKFIASTVNQWIQELPTEEREIFIEAIFSVLNSTKAKTNSELGSNIFSSAKTMFKSYSMLSPQTRNTVGKVLQLLLKVSVSNIESTGLSTALGLKK